MKFWLRIISSDGLETIVVTNIRNPHGHGLWSLEQQREWTEARVTVRFSLAHITETG